MRSFLPLLFTIISPAFLQAQPTSGSPVPKIRLTDSVRCTSVKDQSQSPTCWVFGTNSLFESDILKLTGKRLNLSEMFIARYAYIDKAKAFLASNGKTYFAGGGQFHDVLRVIDHYGMVPEEVYTGRPGYDPGHNHAALDTAMKKYVDSLLKDGKRILYERNIRELNDTLDKYLGKLKGSFWYDLSNHSPSSFAKEFIPPTSSYAELMSFSNLPYYKKCLLEDKFNWAGDSIYNIPLTDLEMIVDSALAKGWSVGWEGDVTNDGFNSFSGFASTNLNWQTYDAVRVQNYKTEKTERDHMLHIVGIGKDETGKKWYYLKNSWGAWMSNFKGYLYMDEDYFRLNTVIIMCNKAGLTAKLKTKLGL